MPKNVADELQAIAFGETSTTRYCTARSAAQAESPPLARGASRSRAVCGDGSGMRRSRAVPIAPIAVLIGAPRVMAAVKPA
jgi:hypothetical protein